MKKEKTRSGTRIILLAFLLVAFLLPSHPVFAATDAQKQAVADIFANVFYENDSSTQNIFKYRLKADEFLQLYQDMTEGELMMIRQAYGSDVNFSYSQLFGYVYSFNMNNADDDALNRYERLKKSVEAINLGLEEGMTDLDKVIYFHDKVVEYTTYKKIGKESYVAGGALGDGYAVCAGYAKAMKLLLRQQGMEAEIIVGDTLNHGWLVVKLDGEWYHIDPTWDDTRSGMTGFTGHAFLLRNDEEFAAEGRNSHVDWHGMYYDITSASSTYTDWYVHDIVGKMAYEDGYWYFVDNTTGNLARATGDGKEYQVLLSGENGSFRVLDADDGTLIYQADGVKKEVAISQLLEDMDAIRNAEEDVQEEISDSNGDNTGEGIEEGAEESTGESIEEGTEEGTKEGTEESAGEGVEESTEESTEQNTESVSFEEMQWNAIENWQSGEYLEGSGEYAEHSGKICLKEYVDVSEYSKIKLDLSDTRFSIRVLEYDSNGNFLAAEGWQGEKELVLDEMAAYIKLVIHFGNTSAFDFDAYSVKLKYGLMIVSAEAVECRVIEGSLPGETKENTSGTENESLDGAEQPVVEDVPWITEIAFATADNWKTGEYSSVDGAFLETAGRICLMQWSRCEAGENYTFSNTDSRFHLIINEYDIYHNFVASHDVAGEDTITTTDSTVYLTLSVYFPGCSSFSFRDYEVKLKYQLMVIGVEKESAETVIIEDEQTPLADGKDESMVRLQLTLLILITFIVGLFGVYEGLQFKKERKDR